MKFLSDFFKAIGNCFKGFSVIFEKGLWPYLFYPVLVKILLLIAMFVGFASLADFITHWVNQKLAIDSIPESGHWLSWARSFLTGYFSIIVRWVFKIIFWFISGTISKYILLIILSPLFALLSEKTEEKLTGNKFPFSILQLLKDVLRGILISLRNMLLEFLIILLCFVLNIIFPVSAIVTFPFLLFVSWYYYGFSMLDYSCERYKYGISASLRFIRSNKGYACGIGLVYWFFISLPTVIGDFIGIMFGPTLAVVGATASFLALVNLKKINKP